MYRRRFLCAVGALSALSGCATVESAVGMDGGPDYPSRAAHAEALIHEKVNEEREANGLPPLERNEQLDEVAQYHSDDMAENEYYAHTSPDGESLKDRYLRFNIRCAGGENLFKMVRSYGVDPVDTADDAINSWMKSPGHRRNILHSRYSIDGVGVTLDEDTAYVTHNFC